MDGVLDELFELLKEDIGAAAETKALLKCMLKVSETERATVTEVRAALRQVLQVEGIQAAHCTLDQDDEEDDEDDEDDDSEEKTEEDESDSEGDWSSEE